MFESKYSKLLTVGLVGGIILVVGVLIFLGCMIANNNKLNQDAEDAVSQFQGQVNKDNDTNQISNTISQNTIVANNIAPSIGIENLINNNSSSNSNKPNTYKGYPMVGTIEIPAINLQYPILEDTSKGAIEVAVAMDKPTSAGLNKVGNTTIVGHNYRNGTFFSNNKKLVEGDKVYITDTAGQKVTYIIYKTFVTSPEDSSFLDRDTEGRREITLDTCTDDAKSRLIILAKEQ